MLKVSHLSIHYGTTQVVSDLSFSLDHDEILMLVGPTGCGKTTILKSLAGLVPISQGEMTIGNGTHHWTATPKKQVPPEKRNVGMVFQDFALFPHLTVQENIEFRLSDAALANHWIDLLGLSAFRKTKPNSLSGGQKQRVALARTLAHEPAYVLLDEPLSNLDAALKDDLRWEIRQALKSAGVPALWVTHDQDEALSVGDRIGVLRNGNLEQLDSPENCYSQPANRFVAGFLGEASFISGEYHASTHQITTQLGDVPCAIEPTGQSVDVLLRPEDLSITTNTPTNGVIHWSRYEGSARLYSVLLDGDREVKIRTRHDNRLMPGDQVRVDVNCTHPLTVFPKEPG